ncbi:actin-binding LIM protein 1-like isoform X3 [Biomphalaria glabrata]|uniref:Actin-binding LIM protein 1-like isoform X3 n=1 Tax=Biomphalaria glabrata TaxID=6526 RepID=A0A9W3BKT3_BIOGL|nr:actin-binding LIM protein 1-like isoform X3 [Biomphalaria glabrata]
MGTKPGKHARDTSGGADGSRDSPSPKRSPKGSSAKKGDVASGLESSALTTGDTSGLGTDPKDDQENLYESQSGQSLSKSQHRPVVEEDVIISKQQTSLKMERDLEPLTPLVIHENHDVSITQHKPQATSTPAANGQLRSPPLSPDSGTDQSDDEAFSPNDQQCLMHSLTGMCFPWSSNSSKQDSLDSRRSGPNFGRFYNTSYLGKGKAVFVKGAPITVKEKEKPAPSGSHFHRPPNFTYSKEPPDFLKKKTSGMSALASGQKRIVKVRRSSSPADLKAQEPIRMSMFPSAKPKLPNEVDKIERDDWPAPASPAAILPEILRQRRRSRGEKDDDDEEEEVQEDPKIKRELEEISKIKDESGIGRVIYKELDKLKAKPHMPLDPWKASRAPSAKFEPRYRTRYQSPMFASPSRFLDRPRYAWDDSDIRTYRSASTLANLPTPKPGYGPSYMTPRAATLPLAGAYGARVDFRYFDFGESDGRERSTHTSSSTLTGDTSSRRHDSSYTGYDGPNISLLQLQKNTWHTEIEPTMYPYEKLKITNFDLPKDVDTNQLEIHLSNQEFENLFKMPRENFYKMAEWKRNDMKRKLHLY